MADTQLEQVLDAITAQLKTITTPEYECDLGGRVYLARMLAGAETRTPYITLWQPWDDDGPQILNEQGINRPFTDSTSPRSVISVRHYLQGFAAKHSTDPTRNAYILHGCIEKCLGRYSKASNALSVPGLVRIELGYGLVRPAGGEMSMENPYCIFTLDIILSVTRGEPYV